MKSFAGLVVLVLLVLWLGYYVPYRVQNRQRLVEAHAEDRFSGSLRVLAVAGEDGPGATPGVEPSARITRSLLGSGAGPQGTHAIEAGHPNDDRPQEEGRREVDTVTTNEPSARPPSARAELLARRAAAAHRRLVLSAVFLVVSIACWGMWGFDLLAWYAAAIPTAVLLTILVLGHRAVAKIRRDDARWRAEQATRRRVATARARSDRREYAPGAPVMPRRAQRRVTGRAVRGSQESTQMIPRVAVGSVGPEEAPDDPSGEADRAAPGDRSRTGGASRPEVTAADDSGAKDSATDGSADGGPAAEDSTPTEVVDTGRIVAEAFAAATAAVARSDHATPARSDSEAPAPSKSSDDGSPAGAKKGAPATASGRAWDPVPVPPPTYTMKPAAPQRAAVDVQQMVADVQSAVDAEIAAVEPAVDGAEPANRIDATPNPADQASGSSDRPRVGPPEPASGDEQKPKTETLGLDLNEILARRRVAGQ